MEFLNPEILKYSESHTSPESALLQKINRETHADVLLPRMLSGHMQGRILSLFSKMIKPKRILEIGTYTGYSALCLAEGLPASGKLITIDVNEELEDRVRGYIKESQYCDQIEFKVGNALDIIPTLEAGFQLVFIDALKEEYKQYYDLVWDKLDKGGIIIADNVLWSGKVVSPEIKKIDKDTKALIEFNDLISKDKRVEKVLLPVRDGLLIIRKK